ncbi:MAG: hypothetical protein MUP76_08280 [Acidimicrobiia bacterium]|nr:hypothetical protein [Acidimicrobiia bacterium]
MGNRLTADRTSGPLAETRSGLCKVVCGAISAGVCLHLLAAVAAVTLGISMIVIAVAGPAAPWIGGMVLGGLATAGAFCVARNRHKI